jgi:phage tail sheath protein FI
VNEGAATFTPVTTRLRILAGDVDVDKFLATTMDDLNDQAAIQIQAKAKGLARKFRRTLAIGDSGTNAKEFDGVKVLTPAGQVITAGANGAALTFSMLDELCDAIPNGADAIMMRPGTLRAYRALVRAAGGILPDHIIDKDFGVPVLRHNGIPIIENEFLPGNETQGSSNVTCSVYAMRLNEGDGLHGIWGGPSAGIVFENVGTVQNKDAQRYRLKWYVGTALKSTKSLAAIRGVTSI